MTTLEHLQAAARLLVTGGFCQRIYWNDAPGRTKGEVLELFNYAIALEAGKVAA